MSNRSKKRKDHHPQLAECVENDWLYWCPKNAGTRLIAECLWVTKQPVTEVSAKHWQHDWQMANSFMAAYDYPTAYWFQPNVPVNWDAFNDWMLIRTLQTERTPDRCTPISRFVGELVIVRDSWEAAENTLSLLLSSIAAHVKAAKHEHHAQARILLVLEGLGTMAIPDSTEKRVS